MYITICEVDSRGDSLYDAGSSNLVLCDTLEGWDGVGVGGRFKRERTYVYLWLICVDVWQKPTQYCKPITLQLKISKLKKKNWLVVTKAVRSREGKYWEFRISRCKLVYIGWINNKVLLYSTENYIQYPTISHNGKEYEKEKIYIYV